MPKNLVSELILEKLAGGSSFKDLQSEFRFSKKDLISAALYGVAELQEEYISLLVKKYKKR